jgi:hypothetical protein
VQRISRVGISLANGEGAGGFAGAGVFLAQPLDLGGGH